MTPLTQLMAKEDQDEVTRLTIRIEPELNDWLERVAAYLLTDKSKFVRRALLESANIHVDELSPRLMKEFERWREAKGRKDGL